MPDVTSSCLVRELMRIFPLHHVPGFPSPMPFWSRESEHVAGLGVQQPILRVSCFVARSGYVRRAESYARPFAFLSLYRALPSFLPPSRHHSVVIAHRARFGRPAVDYILTKPSWNSHTSSWSNLN